MRTLAKNVLLIALAALFLLAAASCSSDSGTTSSGGGDSGTAQTGSGNDGGGSDGSSAEPRVLKVAAFEGGFGRAYFDALKVIFEDEFPGVTVELTASPDIDEIVQPLILAGNAPDVLMSFGMTRIGQMAAEGAMLDLTPIFYEDAPGMSGVLLRDIITDGLIDTICRPLGDGRIFYAPTDAGAAGLYYNKGLMDANGWSTPRNWDEFFALGDLANAQGVSLYTYQGQHPGYNDMVLMPMIASSAGVDALDKILNYEEGAWLDPNVIRALDIFVKIANDGYLLPGTVAMSHTEAQTEFLLGNALFIPCGTWIVGEMADVTPPDFEWGFTSAPGFGGNQRFLTGGCSYNVVLADGQNNDLALEWIRLTYREDIIRLLAELNGSIMPVKGAVDMSRDLIDVVVYNTFKAYDDAAILLPTWGPLPVTEVSIIDEIYNPMSDVMNGRMTALEWAESIERATVRLRAAIADAS